MALLRTVLYSVNFVPTVSLRLNMIMTKDEMRL